MSWWGDVQKIVSQYYTDAWAAATGGAVKNASGDAAAAVKTAEAQTTTISSIWAELTNGKMWRSLGWLLLGILLMLVGALALARQSAQSVAAGLARGVI